MINKYSEINNLIEYIDESLINLQCDTLPLNEGSIMDFLRMVRDTQFKDSIYLSPDNANKYKYFFAESFIRSLSGLKFKFWNATNLIFKPKQLIKKMQDELLQKIKMEWAGEYGKSDTKISDIGGRTRILFLESKYPNNTPLVEELYQIMKYIKSNIENMLTNHLNRRYPSNPIVGNEQTVNSYKDKFKTEFLTIFQPMNKKIFKSMDGKSQFDYIGYKLIKDLNRNFDINVKNMFIVSDKYASDPDYSKIAHFPTGEIIKKDRIKSYLDSNPEGSLVTIIQEYIKRYNKPKVVPDANNPEYIRYTKLAQMANDELKYKYAKENDFTKQINKDDIISRMNIIENTEDYAKEIMKSEEDIKSVDDKTDDINKDNNPNKQSIISDREEKGTKKINKPTAHALATEYMTKYQIPTILRNKYFELAQEANEILYDRVNGVKSKMKDKDIIEIMRELDVDGDKQ